MEDEMNRVCSTNVKKRNAYRTLEAKPDRKRPLGRPQHRWSTILKWILERWDGILWIGLVWRRIGISGGLL
jgi:hypothetical protein